MQTFTLNVYKIFLFKKKTNEMFNQRLLQCKILNYFKDCTDNAFKILVTLNLAHTVS